MGEEWRLLEGVSIEKSEILDKGQKVYERPNWQLTGRTPDVLGRLALEAAKKAS